MPTDAFIASLPAFPLDGPAPFAPDAFRARCREVISARAWAKTDAAWRDLDTQLRNAAAAERARLAGADPAAWRRPARGCSLYWANRVTQAFQEKDPARRERLLDQTRWDAAGELVPAAAPLSPAAAYAYALRLDIAARRAAAQAPAGNEVFNRLTAAAAPESVLKKESN